MLIYDNICQPHAYAYVVCSQQYVFGSLMSRDNTFRLLFSIWQQKLEVHILLLCCSHELLLLLMLLHLRW